MPTLLLNKPYGVMTQFTDPDNTGRPTLKDFVPVREVYPVGRLDFDSEGLLLLTDDATLQHQLSDPRFRVPKTYWAQVEGTPTPEALAQLRAGVALNTGRTAPAQVRALPTEPALWERTPPIRYRAAIPTSWLELELTEGKNRQVRRMTAAVGLPTLRLVRWRLGALTLADLAPGEWRELTPAELLALRGPERPPKADARATQPENRPTNRPGNRGPGRPSGNRPSGNRAAGRAAPAAPARRRPAR